jgi:phage terminase large subunit
MISAEIALPPKLIELFDGEADVRCARGGRGSGKTRSFAKMTAVRAYMWAAAGENGQILCGRRIMKTLADSSMEEVRLAILEEPWLAQWFDIGETYIRTKGLAGSIYYTFLGLDRNIDSVKSQARIRLAWVDEAEGVIDEAWTKLIPTLREEDSELWVTYNPERKASATNKRFGNPTDPRYKMVEINWRDNPRFPAKLERDRQRDQIQRPDQYEHIWEGAYVSAVTGAYYAPSLTEARQAGRISVVARDPLLPIKAFFDIGGTGRSADATSIIIAQFIGMQIRVLDYYEARHQPLATHVNWLRERGYAKCHCVLPHDGVQGDKVFDAAYEPALIAAGFDAETIKNQGKGAAKLRIEAGRRLFPSIWFNQATTEGLVDALGWYHEKIDEERNIGLGPDHDWSSHAADAFGLMCVAYEQPSNGTPLPQYDLEWAS